MSYLYKYLVDKIMIIIYWFKHYIDSQSVDGLPLSRATGSNKNYTNI